MKRMNVWIAVVGMAMAFSACKPGAKTNQETEETKVTEQKRVTIKTNTDVSLRQVMCGVH